MFYAALVRASVVLSDYYVEVPAGAMPVGFSWRRFTKYLEDQKYRLGWPLHRAEAATVDDQLITAAGLPAPAGPPLVHYSPGVDVAIGRPEKCK